MIDIYYNITPVVLWGMAKIGEKILLTNCGKQGQICTNTAFYEVDEMGIASSLYSLFCRP
jgi:hypothetical protein